MITRLDGVFAGLPADTDVVVRLGGPRAVLDVQPQLGRRFALMGRLRILVPAIVDRWEWLITARTWAAAATFEFLLVAAAPGLPLT